MLKGKQTVMGLETYEKEATLNTHVSAVTKQTKIRFLGKNITLARTSLCMHEYNLHVQARSCIHRSLPRKPNLLRNRAEAKQNINVKSNNLTYLKK